ncbi:MAG: hypothetical protein J7L55_05035 [Desulfurococcales archaeon]|nr:hypothetical protein [Desulfurococcales archaeon]
MPVVFRCKGCGKPIYVFERVGQDCFGVPSPSELFTRLGGRCPHCGRVLEPPTLDDIRIHGRVKAPLSSYLDIRLLASGEAQSHGSLLATTAVNH